jgi:hypothetical protein
MVVHKMSATPVSGSRTVRLPAPGSLAAIMPNLFAWDPDGQLTDAAMARKEQAAKDRQAAEEKARLIEALQARDRAHAEELVRVKSEAENDALFGSVTRFMAASSAPDYAPKPRSLLAEAREARRIEQAEAAKASWQDSLASTKRQFPPREYPELYAHLGAADVPELFDLEVSHMDHGLDTAPAPVSAAKPNDHAPPPATEPAGGMRMGVRWGLAALGLGALVAAIVRFPLKP